MQKMTQGIIQDVQRALALKAALEVGNDTLRKLRGDRPALNFYGAPAYDEIMFALTASLALTLSKLFDPVTLFLPPATKKKQSVNKSDVISIPLLVRLLKQRRCQTVLGKTPARRGRCTVRRFGTPPWRPLSKLNVRGSKRSLSRHLVGRLVFP
jgi:hypothetical protein